jgi:hypothetical protein
MSTYSIKKGARNPGSLGGGWWVMRGDSFFERYPTKKQAQKALDTMQPVVIGHCPNCGHALYKGHI